MIYFSLETDWFSDLKNEMWTLNKDLQLQIVELAEILVDKPSQYAPRVEDISLIFNNLHHIMNSLWPHQVSFDHFSTPF
jgi:mediator of RNA polymerase II transcription subunit 7